mgnify:CR=1 FL=1
MKVFMWFGSQKGNGYDIPTETVKVYAVAEDLPAARRQLDKILSMPNVKGANQLRNVINTTRPQVFAVPFAEVNISHNGKAMALVASGEEGSN